MQKTLFIFFTLGSLIFSFSGCVEDKCEATRSFVEFRPVWLGEQAIEDDIKVESVRPLENPGKIYYYDEFILINEKYRGIHVINNQNPSNPTPQIFLNIPGNIDMAIKDGILYADNYKDILLIDLQNIQQASVVNRIRDIKQPIYSNEFGGRILLYYEPTDRIVEVDCSDLNFDETFWLRGGGLLVNAAFSEQADMGNSVISPSSGPQGIAGSMARFALFNQHFYYVSEYELHVYSAESAKDPEFINIIYMPWGVETIFPYKENLFIGANNGMHIFDNSNPADPVYLSSFEHAQACDPVVIEGNTAYITLRDGVECQDFTNQLDVVDIEDLLRPVLIKSYPMHNPHGLGIRNSILYLCDGDEGLKIFDTSDKLKIDDNQLSEVSDIHGYDVIPVSDKILLLIGQDGFYQFDISDPEKPELLSKIEVSKS